ncbi:hypothetical protein LWM68_36610 [Niabella sp. W65]|nr:hypothetical protein [Niabella sp. W65]MCH7367790.1 hypothetical protein [Niabella sp. W65]
MINIAGHAAGHPQSYLAEQQYGNLSGKTQMQAVPDLEEYYQSGTFLTEALTRECLKALETPVKRKEPFFSKYGTLCRSYPHYGGPEVCSKIL